MEQYQGVKFTSRRLADDFAGFDEPLALLHHWTLLLSQLGLAPLHQQGAYGNQSCRTAQGSFIITRSAMQPSEKVNRDEYCHVVRCDAATNSCDFHGSGLPSSETLLHGLIYSRHPWVGAILHGHSPLLLQHAPQLGIPITGTAHPYGTRELAWEAVAMVKKTRPFFNLRDHGFVALGHDLPEAGRLALVTYRRLLNLLLEQN